MGAKGWRELGDQQETGRVYQEGKQTFQAQRVPGDLLLPASISYCKQDVKLYCPLLALASVFFCGGLCSVAFSVPAFKGGLLFGFVLFLTTPDVRSRSYLIFSHLLLLLVIRAVWLPHCGGQSTLEGTN